MTKLTELEAQFGTYIQQSERLLAIHVDHKSNEIKIEVNRECKNANALKALIDDLNSLLKRYNQTLTHTRSWVVDNKITDLEAAIELFNNAYSSNQKLLDTSHGESKRQPPREAVGLDLSPSTDSEKQPTPTITETEKAKSNAKVYKAFNKIAHILEETIDVKASGHIPKHGRWTNEPSFIHALATGFSAAFNKIDSIDIYFGQDQALAAKKLLDEAKAECAKEKEKAEELADTLKKQKLKISELTGLCKRLEAVADQLMSKSDSKDSSESDQAIKKLKCELDNKQKEYKELQGKYDASVALLAKAKKLMAQTQQQSQAQSGEKKLESNSAAPRSNVKTSSQATKTDDIDEAPLSNRLISALRVEKLRVDKELSKVQKENSALKEEISQLKKIIDAILNKAKELFLKISATLETHARDTTRLAKTLADNGFIELEALKKAAIKDNSSSAGAAFAQVGTTLSAFTNSMSSIFGSSGAGAGSGSSSLLSIPQKNRKT